MSAPSNDIARIFLGNLQSEATTVPELTEIFSKYGRVVEVVIKRSFGFVQFETHEAAVQAIEGENGRKIGNLVLGEFRAPQASQR